MKQRFIKITYGEVLRGVSENPLRAVVATAVEVGPD